MSLEPVEHSNNTHTILHPQTVSAFTLVETLIAMTLIAVVFIITFQSFNALIMASYLSDARSAVRNEGEFVEEFFKLRIKNADPETITLLKTGNNKVYGLQWQDVGSTDNYAFFYDVNGTSSRFCLEVADASASQTLSYSCDSPGASVLTYNDVIVRSYDDPDSPLLITSTSSTDPATGQVFASVSMRFTMDSAVMLGDHPAVQNVSRFMSIAVR